MVWRTFLSLALLALATGQAPAQDLPLLSAEALELLPQLDPRLAREVLIVVPQLEGWSEVIATVRGDLQAGRASDPAVADRVICLARVISRTSPPLQNLIGLGNAPLASASPQGEIDAEPLARAAQAIETVEKPARYLIALLDSELGKRFLGRPITVGPVRFTLAQPDFSRSLFSPTADLAITLSYPALGLELKAHGVYFRPRSGDLPEPVLDPARMRIDTSGLQVLAEKGLTRLGEEIPELGVPIRVKEPRFSGFQGDSAGSVSFRIIVNVGGAMGIAPEELLGLEAGVTVASSGKIELDGPLTASIERPIPLGMTGLVLDGVKLELRPKDRTEPIQLQTYLAPALGGKEGLALEVTIRLGLSQRARSVSDGPPSLTLLARSPEIRFAGRLMLARREALGQVEGTFTQNGVAGRLRIPDPQGNAAPTGELLKADLSFEMNKEGIQAQGSASLASAVSGQVSLLLPFTGQGTLMASENCRLLALAVPASVTARFAPGFRQLELDADMEVEVDLEVLKVMASVSIHAVSAPRPSVEVTAQALGVKVNFRLDHLDQLTMPRLRQELKASLTALYDNLLGAVAELEKEGGQLLSQVEQHLRGGVCRAFHRVGLERACCGCKEADGRLADLACGRKNLIGWGLLSRVKAGKWLAEVERPVPRSLSGFLEILERELIVLLDADKRKHLQEQAEREKQIDNRLEPVVAAINGGAMDRTLDRLIQGICQAGNNCREGEALRPRTITRLHLSCEHAVSAACESPLGALPGTTQPDGVLAFVITSSGFQCNVNPVRTGWFRRQHSSDVRVGVVRFVGLLDGSARPRARIVLPELDHGSCLPARDYLFDTLAGLIERLLPGVEVEGRQHERDLAVRNGMGEPVRFWVQVLTRSETTGQWTWQPAGPERPDRAYAFQLPAGQTVALQIDHVQLKGAVARVRALSASGVIWGRSSPRELWLVEEHDTLGQRCYRASERALFTFDLEADKRVVGPQKNSRGK